MPAALIGLLAVLCGCALAVAPASAQTPGPVLVVGDSLEVGTEPYLRRELAGVDLTVDAEKSRPSEVGVDVLRGAIQTEHEVVVFDLGTNDDPSSPERLAASLDAARQIAGDRCMVVATINRPSLNGVSSDGLNGVIARFASSTGAQVADWRAAAGGPGLLQPDGVHATAEGYALRARLVADAVEACFALSAPADTPRPRRRPDPAPPAPSPELGPGLGLLVVPVAAIVDRALRILGFTRVAGSALRPAFDPVFGLGERLIGRMGRS